MAKTYVVYPDSKDIISRNLRGTMELASSSAGKNQNSPQHSTGNEASRKCYYVGFPRNLNNEKLERTNNPDVFEQSSGVSASKHDFQ